MTLVSSTARTASLDEVDKILIRDLRVDGRMPYSRLAPLVGLSEAATRRRVNKLIKGGVTEVVAVTDPAGLGIRHRAIVGINVDTDVSDVAEALSAIEAGVYPVINAGRHDILLEVFTADEREFLAS